ncbi:patatin-like phospholipase family protein [Lysobacter niastensis]|uniref:Patatin-like phospholipase family protein n=1 Tax=Lysobacter niastensis TaxID=380629 RepID=A0ABS0B5C1_9GAMM|nr:patatin-like phospholipase family protein [Lysobacter niastensis]MBF6024020.1 patatin-like phospholipase family protein [Lysobacter niastensis]
MRRSALSILFAVTAACAALFLQGCASPGRQKAVPAEATFKAEIPGMPGVRYVMPEDMPAVFRDAQEALAAELKARADTGATGPLPPVSFLAVSGGGDNGAYGAGLLNGWTAAGTRPEFKLVTGISTGALIAPFAFLGPRYDDVLRKFYTSITSDDILEERNKLSVLFQDGLADNAPLKRLVRKVVTAEMLKEIASEHAKGRVLFVATTNIDARRPVVWNMTKIAASGHPDSLELFQEILVASAAIPGAFPPTMFDVEVDGQPYQEMHVDGGAFSQVFVYPAALELKKVGIEAGADRGRTLYIIRNSKVMPDWSQVERKTLPIIGRAIASLIQTQGIGDLYRIYAISQRDEVDFNLAYIPESFNAPHKEEFDTAYMRALFDVGYEQASKGYPWVKRPPGM